ncbi:MAG: hypothetical protein QE283_00930 [Rhodoferax sp.]|nr:hypothetical protein [Rhodoferax sp.]
MVLKFRFISALATLTLVSACGGGGDLEAEFSPPDSPSAGLVVDGYLSIAKVVCDTNGNGLEDSGEPVTYTNTQGSYVFRTGCAFGVLASGGTNLDTNSPFLGQLRAPAGAAVVTPLTTLIAAGMTQDQVISALSLPIGSQVLTTDPAAKDGGVYENLNLYKKSLAVQHILQKSSNLLTTLGNSTDSKTAAAIYGQAANAYATQLKKEDSPLIGSNGSLNSSVVNRLLASTVELALVAEVVPQAIKDAIIAAGGASTLPALVDVAFTNQAQNFVDATNDDALAAVTSSLQKNTIVEDNVAAAAKAGTLSTSTTAEQVIALKANISVKAAPTVPVTEPAFPTALAANVISLYGDGYSTVKGTDTPKWGGMTTTITAETYVGNNLLKLATFNYQGFTNTAPLDVSTHTNLHIDFWSKTATTIEVKLVSLSPTVKQQSIYIPVDAGTWTSKDIPLSSFTVPDKTKFQQLIVAAGTLGQTLYVDNVYFWK